MDKELPISPWPEWKIISKIGEGSFGRVYKAQRTEKGRSFYSAIKIITIPASKGELDSVRSESGDEKSVRGYFENLVEECIQEVSTMEYFRGNSHIVSVEDYKVMEYLDEIGWDIFIRMEYLTSFMEYYAGKNLTEKEVMKLGIDLCKSLEYCGQLHIIHRDIKPQNIIISKEGKVKVTDFGIAKVASSSTINSSSTMGSVHYISPEQARGGYSDARSDIYSLGITIFEMLTGTVPFDGDSTVAVAVQHIQDEIPAPSTVVADIPLSIDRIVIKCTQKKPDRRYQTAAELITDLKKALVMPDEDFVKMAPAYAAAGVAATASSDTEEVNAGENDDALSDDDIFLEDDENEDSDNELQEDDEDVDIDDEDNDKLDLIMKIIGIGIAVIILIVTIFVIVKLVGSTKSHKNENTETLSTTEETVSTANAKDTVTVPKVEGMTKDEAVKALNDVGLGYKQVVQSSKTVAKDTVISQGTKAGAKVAKNTQIILTISGGEEVVNTTVPSVTGESESDAREKLESGFG